MIYQGIQAKLRQTIQVTLRQTIQVKFRQMIQAKLRQNQVTPATICNNSFKLIDTGMALVNQPTPPPRASVEGVGQGRRRRDLVESIN